MQEVKPVGINATELARLTATLESKSTHLVARAILEHDRPLCRTGEFADTDHETVSVEGVDKMAGHGLKGRIEGKGVLVGTAKLLRKFKVSFDEALTKNPFAVVMTAIEGKFAGYVTIADKGEPDAAQTVKRLQREGIRTVMLSSVKSAVRVEADAKQVGVDEWYGDLLPED